MGAQFYRGADACVLVFDRSTRESFARLDRWRDEFLLLGSPAHPDTFPFLVLGNKSDLVDRVCVSTEEAEAWCADNRIPVRGCVASRFMRGGAQCGQLSACFSHFVFIIVVIIVYKIHRVLVD